MNFSRKKLVLGMALLGLTSMVSATVYARDVDHATLVTPTAGTATIDGNISEWNTGAGSPDFSAKMCTAGSIGADGNCEGNGKVQLSTMYSRYDCNTDTMYVLVLRAGSYWPNKSASDAWVKIYNLSQNPQVDGNSSTFSWVAPNGVQGSTLIGYEASFKLAAGTYNDAQVHLNVNSNTSSTGKNGDTMTITVPATCTMPVNAAAEAAAKAAAEAAAAEATAKAAADAETAAKAAAEAEAAAKAAEEAAKSADCGGTDSNAPTSTTVSWADDKGTNGYGFTVTKEGNTWTYQVDKAGGKDLSHWTLIVPSCVSKVTDATNGIETGQDGSIKDRNVSGIKWNSEGGTFSFTLDGDYAVSTVEVLAKAGNGYSTSMIMGPDCSMPASNACPPPSTEYVTSIVGSFYDDNICNLMNKDAKKNIGKSHLTSGWIVEQWVPMDGYLDTLNSVGEMASSGLPVSLSGDENVKICPAGVMKGGCNEGNAVDTQAFTTGENGKVDFAVLVKWPGVPDAVLVPAYEVIRYGQDGIGEVVKKGSFIDGTPVRANYNITAIAGKTGVEIIGGLEKDLLWNPGMSETGCTLTLKKRSHK